MALLEVSLLLEGKWLRCTAVRLHGLRHSIHTSKPKTSSHLDTVININTHAPPSRHRTPGSSGGRVMSYVCSAFYRLYMASTKMIPYRSRYLRYLWNKLPRSMRGAATRKTRRAPRSEAQPARTEAGHMALSDPPLTLC